MHFEPTRKCRGSKWDVCAGGLGDASMGTYCMRMYPHMPNTKIPLTWRVFALGKFLEIVILFELF
jgi:hypothetical protein